MKYQTGFGLLFSAIVGSAWLAPAFADSPAPAANLSGQYQVRGDCLTRNDQGRYHKCRAMNTLTLHQTSPGHYEYDLSVNTFATTQGACDLSGHLAVAGTPNQWRLQAPEGDNTCRVTFAVDRHRITLIPPPGADDNYYRDTDACRNEVCSLNASLYSDPFPRRSRKALKLH